MTCRWLIRYWCTGQQQPRPQLSPSGALCQSHQKHDKDCSPGDASAYFPDKLASVVSVFTTRGLLACSGTRNRQQEKHKAAEDCEQKRARLHHCNAQVAGSTRSGWRRPSTESTKIRWHCLQRLPYRCSKGDAFHQVPLLVGPGIRIVRLNYDQQQQLCPTHGSASVHACSL